MAGHSHWAGIKYKKGTADARRGKLFSKIARKIILAARERGGDPDMNLKLRYAIDEAKAANMPKDNIERAIKKGTGEAGSTQLLEVVYEGYGPGGVAAVVEVMTDNRNRTVAEIRKIFEKRGGKMGETGCVSWMFNTKGIFHIETEKITEEELMELALEAGAEDIKRENEIFEVITEPSSFEALRQAIIVNEIEPAMAKIMRVPSTNVPVNEETGRKVIALINALEEHDDVVNVYANYEIDEEIMDKIINES